MEDELEFDWHKFFLEAGIPETHALSYADVFVDNRITEAMMDDLDKDVLAELGVAAIGDVLAIQKAARIAASSDGSNIGITKNQKEIWERERKRFENQLVSERTTFKSEKEKLNDRLKMRNEGGNYKIHRCYAAGDLLKGNSHQALCGCYFHHCFVRLWLQRDHSHCGLCVFVARASTLQRSLWPCLRLWLGR
eukprot:TRINITY_DN7504_c0_g1_i4.p1 TRINITY_DN7504_c0_g1~~TRINITY_DN7504_c0_g1_i4.p1  ORF type:complete len:193 (+),score=23.55 TRINITY_DN7504_c0_g1_i4:66-644(+)